MMAKFGLGFPGPDPPDSDPSSPDQTGSKPASPDPDPETPNKQSQKPVDVNTVLTDQPQLRCLLENVKDPRTGTPLNLAFLARHTLGEPDELTTDCLVFLNTINDAIDNLTARLQTETKRTEEAERKRKESEQLGTELRDRCKDLQRVLGNGKTLTKTLTQQRDEAIKREAALQLTNEKLQTQLQESKEALEQTERHRQTLEHTANIYKAENDNLATQNNILHSQTPASTPGLYTPNFTERMSSMNLNPSTQQGPPAQIPSIIVHETPRARGTDPKYFDGQTSDPRRRQEEYVNWKSTLANKLTLDRHAYPSPLDRILYTAQRLTGDAYATIRDHIDDISHNPDIPEIWLFDDWEDITKHLDTIYITHDAYAQALRDFASLTMKGRTYPDFISTLIRLGNLAKKDNREKVEALRSKIAKPYRDATVGNTALPAIDDFNAWVTLFRGIHNNISDNDYRTRTGTAPTPTTNTPTTDPNAMDLSAAGFRRGQLTAEERQRRRDNNLCMYCGKPGHWTPRCPSRPPNSHGPVTNTTSAGKA